MNASRNTIILVVLALLVLAAAGYLLFGKGESDPTLSGVDAAASEAEMTFLNLTAQIEPVAFDTSILSDPRFNALQDMRTAIVPENAGRVDPFAPLSGTAPAK